MAECNTRGGCTLGRVSMGPEPQRAGTGRSSVDVPRLIHTRAFPLCKSRPGFARPDLGLNLAPETRFLLVGPKSCPADETRAAASEMQAGLGHWGGTAK